MKKHILGFLCVLLSLSVLLCGCNNKPADDGPKDLSGRYALADNGEAIVNDVSWDGYTECSDNARVFYEIFVGSFSDSNGDGIGDLRGIIERMDYLNDGDPDSGLSLGVEGIWLSPIFKSPSYHKYDVTDYYQVDPQFGTEADLKELIDLCHQRDVKIILDLVINHTGKQNQMFADFTVAHQQNDVTNKYYEYYCYYPQGESAPAGRTFNQLSGTTDRYECNFSNDMPELNYDNPDVRQEVVNIAKHYLDLGVDGFRFDAAKYIYFGDNAKSAEFWSWYMAELRKIKSDIYTVAEVWDSDSVTNVYAPALNCFNFTTSQAGGQITEAVRTGEATRYTGYIQSYLDSLHAQNPEAMVLPFISNHDMDRAAGFLGHLPGGSQMAANLYILTPGSPFIYYGEELGMRGSRGSANTDANRRLAMVWGDDDGIMDPVGANYDSSNRADAPAKEQIGNGDSLYSYYKRLIMIRKANPEIARGEYKALTNLEHDLGGFTAQWQGKTVAVLHNCSDQEVTIDLSAAGLSVSQISAAIGMYGATLDGSTLALGAYTSVVLR